MRIFKKKQTVNDFLKITDEETLYQIKQLLKHVLPKSSILGFDWPGLLKMSYKDVQKCKELYGDSKLIELICFITDIPLKKLLRSDYHEFIYFLSYLNAQFETLNKLEVNLNKSSEKDAEIIEDMAQAGSERLSIFGNLTTIDNLSGGNILNWELVENLPFENVYSKMLMDKIQNEIQRDYQKIVYSKKKTLNG